MDVGSNVSLPRLDFHIMSTLLKNFESLETLVFTGVVELRCDFQESRLC